MSPKNAAKRWYNRATTWVIVASLAAAVSTVIVALQTVIQERAALRAVDIERKGYQLALANTRARLVIRYHILDESYTNALFSPWPDMVQSRPDRDTRQELFEDLRLKPGESPKLLLPDGLDDAPLLYRKYIHDSISWSHDTLKRGESLRAGATRNRFWGPILAANALIETAGVVSEGDGVQLQTRTLFRHIGEGDRAEVAEWTETNTSGNGCGYSDGSIDYCRVNTLVADVVNEGTGPALNLQFDGRIVGDSQDVMYFFNEEQERISKEWHRGIGSTLEPGEHIEILLGILVTEPRWMVRSQSVAWFMLGPHAEVNRWTYRDAIDSGNVTESAREFKPDQALAISSHLQDASCPYVVFADEDGKMVEERRVLVNACNSNRLRREMIPLLKGTRIVAVEEREPEETHIRSIEFWSDSSGAYRQTRRFGGMVLSQGQSRMFPVTEKDAILVVEGFYERKGRGGDAIPWPTPRPTRRHHATMNTE